MGERFHSRYETVPPSLEVGLCGGEIIKIRSVHGFSGLPKPSKMVCTGRLFCLLVLESVPQGIPGVRKRIPS